MNAKALLTLGQFKLELEGSEQFVTQHLESWVARLPRSLVFDGDQAADAEIAEEGADQKGPAPERRTRRAANKSGGPSCASRIRGMIDEQYFSTPRKVAEIADRLREKATPYEGKHKSAALNCHGF